MNLPRLRTRRWRLSRSLGWLCIAAATAAWGQAAAPANPQNPVAARVSSADTDTPARFGQPPMCDGVRISTIPGSHQFTADFLEAIATDPVASPRHADHIWALNGDLDSTVPPEDRTIYLSHSTDGGRTWTVTARIPPQDYDARISEGLRNGLAVAPGGRDFIVTTQEGAFQIVLRPRTRHGAEREPLIRRLPGPVEPQELPPYLLTKKPGDPVRAGVAKMTGDGLHLIVAYGYFDLNPQLYRYHRSRVGAAWIRDGILAPMPTDLDIFSMSFDQPASAHPRSLYVGTGDQAYRLDLRTKKWTQIDGVGDDSAIHSMTVVNGLHLAACWGVYLPVSRDEVERVTEANFLIHPKQDEAGPNVRAYDVEVDPLRPNRLVLAALTGVYVSPDTGKTWRRLNDLPEGEFHTAHFNPDGSVLVSGMVGTFLVSPFADACGPQLRVRE